MNNAPIVAGRKSHPKNIIGFPNTIPRNVPRKIVADAMYGPNTIA